MKPARGIHIVEELSQVGYLLRKAMGNKIKTTGNFFHDLSLAICFPDWEAENPLVQQILGPFQEQFIANEEKQWESELSKLSFADLRSVSRQIRIIIKKCIEVLSASQSEDIAIAILRIAIALYVVSFREIHNRARSDSKGKSGPCISPDAIAAYQLLQKDSDYAKRFRRLYQALGSDLSQDLGVLLMSYVADISEQILSIDKNLKTGQN